MIKLLIALSILWAPFFSQSKQITVSVLSEENLQVGNVVVYLTPKKNNQSTHSNETEIMDQVNTQFLPHILVIQKGTQVRFPNSDSIKHHVYSFSQAKTFELQLYKELQTDPLLFSNLGVIELGCNIHDWMLGYIFVVDTPYFGKTDVHGKLTIDLPEGEYQLEVWHPRIQDDFKTLATEVSLPKDSDVVISLGLPLLPDVNQYEEISGEFSDYE